MIRLEPGDLRIIGDWPIELDDAPADDPTGVLVEIAVTPWDTDPGDDDWSPATWDLDPDTVTPQARSAETYGPAGSNADHELDPGDYKVRIRPTLGEARPVLWVDTLHVPTPVPAVP